MQKIIKKEKVKLYDFIVFIRDNIKGINEDFCLYCKDSDEALYPEMWFYVDSYPEGDDDGNDVFSDFVTDNNLELLYYGEQFIDVVNNVLMQKSNPDVNLIIDALNYYMDNDDFLSIGE